LQLTNRLTKLPNSIKPMSAIFSSAHNSTINFSKQI
jgi:hypothetical protein